MIFRILLLLLWRFHYVSVSYSIHTQYRVETWYKTFVSTRYQIHCPLYGMQTSRVHAVSRTSKKWIRKKGIKTSGRSAILPNCSELMSCANFDTFLPHKTAHIHLPDVQLECWEEINCNGNPPSIPLQVLASQTTHQRNSICLIFWILHQREYGVDYVSTWVPTAC